MNQEPRSPSAEDDELPDDPSPDRARRWLRGSELAGILKHMGPVIPESEWAAALDAGQPKPKAPE